MKISGDSMAGLQQTAARAQEARAAGLTKPKAMDIPAPSATTEPPPGGGATPTAGAVQSAQKPDHATGLDRAIERLQQNAIKSPQAAGLQHALEMLQRNRERGSAVDTQA